MSAAASDDWGPCEPAGIHIANSPPRAWRGAVVELCSAFPSVPDRDPDAVVQLSGVESEVDVEVWLRDGRHAQRRVHAPEALRDVVDALVVIPPPRLPPAAGMPAPYAITATGPAQGASTRELRIEIDAGVVGRSSHSPGYLSAGATLAAAARWHDWVLGLQLRFEPWALVSAGYLPGFELRTSGLGFMLGRDLLSSSGGGVALDAAMTATLLSEAQSVQLPAREVSATEGDVRVGALLRSLLGTGQVRLLLSVEAELSPVRAGREIRSAPELAPLPFWSLGVGVGVSWWEP